MAQALRDASPHLPTGLSRARQVRDLAIAGAQQMVAMPSSEEERNTALERLATTFDDPDSSVIDIVSLREGKARAWRAR